MVPIIALTWSNNPVCADADARFVVSDNGENLSPVQAPERTAPQMSAGLTPMVAPIVRNAIPNVALTV